MITSLQKPGKLPLCISHHFHPDHFYNREILTPGKNKRLTSIIYFQRHPKFYRAQAEEDAIHIKGSEKHMRTIRFMHRCFRFDLWMWAIILLIVFSVRLGKVFHAGDLKQRHWSEESTEEEMKSKRSISLGWC